MDRRAFRIVFAACIVALLAGAPSSFATHRGCGFFGLELCPHTPPAPDPGGDETASVPNIPPGRLFGFNSTGWWRSPSSGVTIEDEVRILMAAGGNFFRTSLMWEDVEPTPGTWNEAGWAKYQGLVDQLREYDPGVTILFELAYSPSWAAMGPCPAGTEPTCLPRRPPAEPYFDEFARYAKEIVRRFDNPATPKIDVAIETWNEPNLNNFWWPYGPDPEHMTAMQCAVYQEVKSSYPGAIVTSAALNGTTSFDNGDIPIGTFLEHSYGHGLKGCMDRLNVHTSLRPGWDFPDNQWNLSWRQIKDAMQGAGDLSGNPQTDRKIWVTEITSHTAGQNAATPQQQLNRLRAMHAKLFTMDSVIGLDNRPVMIEEVSIHTTHDIVVNGTNTGHGVTNTPPGFTPKPALCHFNAQAANGFTYPDC